MTNTNNGSMAGTHRARAKEWGLGVSQTGKEQVAVMFEITQGPCAGRHITWFGYFTDKTIERTFDSLRHCGWADDDIVALRGLDANEVDLVIEPEEYEGKLHDRVKWVNRPAQLALRDQMNAAQAADFATRLRGYAIQHRQKYGQGARPATSASGPRAQHAGAGAAGRPANYQRASGQDWNGPPPSDDDIPF